MESSLPPLNYHGYLPEGIHDTDVDTLRRAFVTNAKREALWDRLQQFLHWAMAQGEFSHAYIDGGFVTDKPSPEDVDVILQPKAPFGAEAFRAMEPFFAVGIDQLFITYSVHLHFWCEGFPGGMNDFRHFFQYLRPQEAAPLGLKEEARKGIVRIKL